MKKNWLIISLVILLIASLSIIPVAAQVGTLRPFRIFINQGTIVLDAPIISGSSTWNAGGVTFTGIKYNVTDTASAGASLLMDLQVGGATRFKVIKDGSIESAFKVSAQVFEGKSVTLVSDINVLSLLPTWNAGGVTFTGIKLNLIDTASAAASLLMDLQVGGVSKFNIEKTGLGTFVSIIDRDVVEQEVVNTTTETTIYTFTLPGGTLSTNKGLRISLVGDYLNNSGGNSDVTIRLKYGGVNIAAHTISGYTSLVSRRGQSLDSEIYAKNATNAQVMKSRYWNYEVSNGTGASNATYNTAVHNSLTVDSSVNQTLAISVQHSVANANISFKVFTVFVEVIR